MDRAEETIDENEVSFAPVDPEEARRKLEALRGAPLDAASRLPVSEHVEGEQAEEQKPAAQAVSVESLLKALVDALKDDKTQAVQAAKEDAAAFFRPMKERLTTRVDADVLAAFKATGKGWQTRINDVLRKNMPGA